MPSRSCIRLSVFALSVTLVGACGGGGSGGGAAAVANSPPQPGLTVTPTDGAAPLTVTFDATSSHDSDGTITRYAWNFGDGSAGAVGSRASHVYTSPGSFPAQLTVTDDLGASTTRAATVNVTPASGNFTLTGRVQILPSSAIDSDVNDPGATLLRNNSIVEAQLLPNPVSLGGYLNQPGQGAAGALSAGGDTNDTYTISLAGAESILLTVTDPSVTITMTLLDTLGTLVDATVVAGGAGALAPLLAGNYFICLDIANGATNYLLNVGQNIPINIAGLAPRASDEFVEDQMIVAGPRVSIPGMRRIAGKNGLALFAIDPMNNGSRANPAGRRPTSMPRHLARRLRTLDAIAQTSRLPAVHSAEPNYLRHIHRAPNDTFYRYQWHYPNINLPLAWDLTQGSDAVIVAVVDTGVLLNHPDLIGGLVAGYDFIRDPSRARDNDGIDADPTDSGDMAFGGSSTFHGTHVAGTIAARTDNAAGVAGIAWNARIMPVRVLGVNGGTSYDVIQGVRFAAGLSNDSGTVPAKRADIINLSLGSPFSSQAEQNTFDQVRNAGVIVVASAGNDASAAPSFPAAYAGVVSVAASTITRTRAPYSNFGPSIDITAPGGSSATDINGDGLGDGIVSTLGDDSTGAVTFGYAALTGTSMAAPHVAGVASLMKAIFPSLTPAQFDATLIAGQLSDDLGAPGRDDQYGHGLINAQKALDAAVILASGAGTPVAAVLVASPTSINFGPFDSTFDVELRNAGGGTLDIAALISNVPWLSATPVTVDASGLGIYQLNVDRTQASGDGTYTGKIVATSTANSIDINVVMQQFAISPTADAGLHYILLIDAVTNLVVKEIAVSATGGGYDFSFSNVGAGQYQIFAGSDSDNDNFVCDAGEACGAFRTLDVPERFAVNGDRSALDFISGFPIDLFHTSAATGATAARATFESVKPIRRKAQ